MYVELVIMMDGLEGGRVKGGTYADEGIVGFYFGDYVVACLARFEGVRSDDLVLESGVVGESGPDESFDVGVADNENAT